ncbi:MAG: haloacid dehalogenase-like hydrolase, partial [Pygmaiobacter sp.]
FRGDSTRAFYFYCVKKQPMLLRYLPRQLAGAALYLLHFVSKTQFKEQFYSFLRGVRGTNAMLAAFWRDSENRIEPWYRAQCEPEDLVISASPEFLLTPICAQLGIRPPIASRVDPLTGRYEGENCKGAEKVLRYRAAFQNEVIEEFYSDSHSDAPLAQLAKQSFLVYKGSLMPWNATPKNH